MFIRNLYIFNLHTHEIFDLICREIMEDMVSARPIPIHSLNSPVTMCRCSLRWPGLVRAFRGVDMSMNVHMKNIKFTVKGKPPVSMDHLTIRGNNVRSGGPSWRTFCGLDGFGWVWMVSLAQKWAEIQSFMGRVLWHFKLIL